MGWAGSSGLYLFTAIVHTAVAAFALVRIRKRAPAPLAEHVTFGEALAAATTVSPIFDAQIQETLTTHDRPHADAPAGVPAPDADAGTRDASG